MKIVADITMSLELEELTDLRRLADKLGISVEETARSCMMDKCKERLTEIATFGKLDDKPTVPSTAPEVDPAH